MKTKEEKIAAEPVAEEMTDAGETVGVTYEGPYPSILLGDLGRFDRAGKGEKATVYQVPKAEAARLVKTKGFKIAR